MPVQLLIYCIPGLYTYNRPDKIFLLQVFQHKCHQLREKSFPTIIFVRPESRKIHRTRLRRTPAFRSRIVTRLCISLTDDLTVQNPVIGKFPAGPDIFDSLSLPLQKGDPFLLYHRSFWNATDIHVIIRCSRISNMLSRKYRTRFRGKTKNTLRRSFLVWIGLQYLGKTL